MLRHAPRRADIHRREYDLGLRDVALGRWTRLRGLGHGTLRSLSGCLQDEGGRQCYVAPPPRSGRSGVPLASTTPDVVAEEAIREIAATLRFPERPGGPLEKSCSPGTAPGCRPHPHAAAGTPCPHTVPTHSPGRRGRASAPAPARVPSPWPPPGTGIGPKTLSSPGVTREIGMQGETEFSGQPGRLGTNFLASERMHAT